MNLEIDTGHWLQFLIPVLIERFGMPGQRIDCSGVVPGIHRRKNPASGPRRSLPGNLLIKNRDRTSLFKQFQRRHQTGDASADNGNMHCAEILLLHVFQFKRSFFGKVSPDAIGTGAAAAHQ